MKLSNCTKRLTNNVKLSQVISFLNDTFNDVTFKKDDLNFVSINKDSKFYSSSEVLDFTDKLKILIDNKFNLNRYEMSVSTNCIFTIVYFRLELPNEGGCLE